MRIGRLTCKSWLYAGVAVVALQFSVPAAAQQRTFDIPAEQAIVTIPEFARQARLQIVAPSEQLRGVMTPAIKGELDARAALARLIANTGLEIASDEGGVITLRVRAGRGAALGAAGRLAGAERPVEEIVVTANKRAERLQSAPISVTALGREQLDKLNAVRFDDYLTRVPGVSVLSTRQGQAQLTLRGVTSGTQPNATVGVYIDETPFTISNVFGSGGTLTPDLDTFDMQRIEILRGPQGTLYGASTLGGLLKYVTNAPDPSGFSGRVVVEGNSVSGGGNGGGVKAMINAPVSDTIAVRASGYRRRDAGYVDNLGTGAKETNQSDIEGGRAAILFRPNDVVEATLSVLAQNLQNGNNLVDIDRTTQRPLYGAYTQKRLIDQDSSMQYRLYNLTAKVDLGRAELVSASSYGTLRATVASDVSAALSAALGGAGVRQDSYPHHRKATQEVRLSSTGENRFDWQAGLFGTHERTESLGWVNGFNPVTKAPIPGLPLIAFQSLAARFSEAAAFGSVTWHMTSEFDMTVGARYSRNRQDFTQLLTGLLGDPTNPSRVQRQRLTSNDSSFTYLINPRWKPDDDLMVYGRIAKGYRPGGPNIALIPPGTPNPPLTFDPDSLVTYEVGVKSTFLDKRLTVNASVFYIDWTDVQLTVVGPTYSFLGNGGAATSSGGELQVTYVPVTGLTLNAGASYIDAKLAKDAPGVGGRKGDRQPTVPHWSMAADAGYEWPLVGALTANVGGAWRYQGSTISSYSTNGTRMRNSGYDLVDLRAGIAQDPWSLTFYVRNVADSHAFTGVGGATVVYGSGAYVQPRTFMLTAAASF